MSKTKWWHKGITPPKDNPMELTNENYHRIINMRDELIDEMRVEISSLKAKINRLQQKSK